MHPLIKFNHFYSCIYYYYYWY